MERLAAQRRWVRLHDDKPYHDGSFDRWAEKPSAEFPYHRDDGVTIWVANLDVRPDDDFLKSGGDQRGDSA
jgi:hypothetical protein